MALQEITINVGNLQSVTYTSSTADNGILALKADTLRKGENKVFQFSGQVFLKETNKVIGTFSYYNDGNASFNATVTIVDVNQVSRYDEAFSLMVNAVSKFETAQVAAE